MTDEPRTPERQVQPDQQVLEGDDDLPRQPAFRRDPYVPEPGPRAGDRRAFAVMRWGWLPLVLAVAVVVWAALR